MLCLCLLGPPGSGKSTIALRLTGEPGWELFRLRSMVSAEKFTTRDGVSYDWLDDDIVLESLHRGVTDAFLAGSSAMVFDNFPGNAAQARFMLGLATDLAIDITLRSVRLVAPVELLAERVARRFVCPACDRDPLGDPHLPATASTEEASGCSRCGTPLRRRPNDSPERHRKRLRRFMDSIDDIEAEFRGGGVTTLHVDASGDSELSYRRILSTRSRRLADHERR